MSEAAQIARLRALRLWHWREAMRVRQAQKTYELEAWSALAKKCDEIAGFHIIAVQTLNDFFSPGDTAEGDDK